MEKTDLTLRILKNTFFPDAYREFLLGINMNEDKYKKILSVATILLNSKAEEIKRLGYRIIVVYCNRMHDYRPLYDVSANMGMYPVSQFIDEMIIQDDAKNIYTEFNAAFNSNYCFKEAYFTAQQKRLFDFCLDNQNESLTVVAPTSYGKTDLIIQTIKNAERQNVCVITPTKSLLLQTKSRILGALNDGSIRIITHPDMYKNTNGELIAVMTQERMLRMLERERDLSFSYVIIDEAHGLLRDDDRNRLLASVVMILNKRNPHAAFKFLTPFLCKPENIKVQYTDYQAKAFKVDEYIKTERIYLAELRSGRCHGLKLYDQFLNRFYTVSESENQTEWGFVCDNAGRKNIVYLNKPKDIEEFASLLPNYVRINDNTEIQEACDALADYVHPQYHLVECLRKGVIYHHGDVPEAVRIYIERLYSQIDDIRYVITSSTLLEGVNLPAEKMFILDNKKGKSNLSSSDFKNLIGRVCRYSQIFDRERGSLKQLEPEIYLVVGHYYSKNANVEAFLQNVINVEKKCNDEIGNVLLQNAKINAENESEFKTASEFVENFENGIIPNYSYRKVKTEAGKRCFDNNIVEVDVIKYENAFETQIRELKKRQILISNSEQLLNVLTEVFFSKSEDENLLRFRFQETKQFYKMFIDWRISSTSLNQMISSFIKYWKILISQEKRDTLVYVGRWGDTTRNGVKSLWTDIATKSDSDLVNLAIVRIKEEQDFLDNALIKYVEVLNDLGIMDNSFYLLVKYGSDDDVIISCAKNGISLGLAKLLSSRYRSLFNVDPITDTIFFQPEIFRKMRENKENPIMICELEMFL